MSNIQNNHGLPFLPGYTFPDVTKSSFHQPQTLVYKNGYAVARHPSVGIGQDPLLSEELTRQEMNALSSETLNISYGPSDWTVDENFVPAHVILDKKVLHFDAYFIENNPLSPEEQYRVRPVVIYYYLVDDSMCIIEPVVKNSGLMQGKRVKRQRLLKNDRGDYYQWKDLNVGMDLEVYGVKYHITQCDAFTKNFMESKGIILGDPEPMLEDPYRKSSKTTQPHHSKPIKSDNMYKFLTMDGKVLGFFALWNTSDSLHRDTWQVIISYYLVDDTVQIREVHERDSGRLPFPILLRRQKIPKKIKSEEFTRCVLEISEDEVDEYYTPKDFQLGKTIKLQGHSFLLYDCDAFTKEYYQKNHPDMEMKPIEVPKKADKPQGQKKEIPPYNGFGSIEDSLQNCLSLNPAPPKKDLIKLLENHGKVLQYSARLDSPNPEDEGRHFILSYHLSDDMMSIFEKPTRNSGIITGTFLSKTRIPKPGSTVENPDYYSPADFAIGATVEVFSHRFVLTDAAKYVLTYLESISGQIPPQTLDSLRERFQSEDGK